MLKKQASLRRRPHQARAQQTQLLIFEAAVRVLERDGTAGFTTNRIAEVAGFSVGTLYRYFSNKEAILDALMQREQERVQAEISQLLHAGRPPADDPLVRIRAVIRAALRVLGGRQHARKALTEFVARTRREAVLDRTVAELAASLTGRLPRGTRAPSLATVEAFALVWSVAGAIRAALAQNVRLLGDPAFENALVDLAVGFLQAREQRASNAPGGPLA